MIELPLGGAVPDGLSGKGSTAATTFDLCRLSEGRDWPMPMIPLTTVLPEIRITQILSSDWLVQIALLGRADVFCAVVGGSAAGRLGGASVRCPCGGVFLSLPVPQHTSHIRLRLPPSSLRLQGYLWPRLHGNRGMLTEVWDGELTIIGCDIRVLLRENPETGVVCQGGDLRSGGRSGGGFRGRLRGGFRRSLGGGLCWVPLLLFGRGVAFSCLYGNSISLRPTVTCLTGGRLGSVCVDVCVESGNV